MLTIQENDNFIKYVRRHIHMHVKFVFRHIVIVYTFGWPHHTHFPIPGLQKYCSLTVCFVYFHLERFNLLSQFELIWDVSIVRLRRCVDCVNYYHLQHCYYFEMIRRTAKIITNPILILLNSVEIFRQFLFSFISSWSIFAHGLLKLCE